MYTNEKLISGYRIIVIVIIIVIIIIIVRERNRMFLTVLYTIARYGFISHLLFAAVRLRGRIGARCINGMMKRMEEKYVWKKEKRVFIITVSGLAVSIVYLCSVSNGGVGGGEIKINFLN